MRTVYKYHLEPNDYVTLQLPQGAKILSIQEQNGHPYLWAMVDTDAVLEDRTFRLAGTGHPIEDENLRFIGTLQLKSLGLVFHLFEI